MLETVREYGLELLGERARSWSELMPLLCRAGRKRRAGRPRPVPLVGAAGRGARQSARRDRSCGVLGDTELELRLAGALWRFWWLRGALAEGRARLERAIAHGQDAPPRLVAQACRGAAGLAWSQGDRARARELAERGLEAASASGDGVVELACHTILGLVAKDEEDFDRARSHLEQSSAIADGTRP